MDNDQNLHPNTTMTSCCKSKLMYTLSQQLPTGTLTAMVWDLLLEPEVQECNPNLCAPRHHNIFNYHSTPDLREGFTHQTYDHHRSQNRRLNIQHSHCTTMWLKCTPMPHAGHRISSTNKIHQYDTTRSFCSWLRAGLVRCCKSTPNNLVHSWIHTHSYTYSTSDTTKYMLWLTIPGVPRPFQQNFWWQHYDGLFIQSIAH